MTRFLFLIPLLPLLGFVLNFAFGVRMMRRALGLAGPGLGRWPAGARQFVLGVARWWLRVQSYLVLLHDQYPPFSLS